MQNAFAFLNGKKSYVVALVAASTAAAQALGYDVNGFMGWKRPSAFTCFCGRRWP